MDYRGQESGQVLSNASQQERHEDIMMREAQTKGTEIERMVTNMTDVFHRLEDLTSEVCNLREKMSVLNIAVGEPEIKPLNENKESMMSGNLADRLIQEINKSLYIVRETSEKASKISNVLVSNN